MALRPQPQRLFRNEKNNASSSVLRWMKNRNTIVILGLVICLVIFFVLNLILVIVLDAGGGGNDHHHRLTTTALFDTTRNYVDNNPLVVAAFASSNVNGTTTTSTMGQQQQRQVVVVNKGKKCWTRSWFIWWWNAPCTFVKNAAALSHLNHNPIVIDDMAHVLIIIVHLDKNSDSRHNLHRFLDAEWIINHDYNDVVSNVHYVVAAPRATIQNLTNSNDVTTKMKSKQIELSILDDVCGSSRSTNYIFSCYVNLYHHHQVNNKGGEIKKFETYIRVDSAQSGEWHSPTRHGGGGGTINHWSEPYTNALSGNVKVVATYIDCSPTTASSSNAATVKGVIAISAEMIPVLECLGWRYMDTTIVPFIIQSDVSLYLVYGGHTISRNRMSSLQHATADVCYNVHHYCWAKDYKVRYPLLGHLSLPEAQKKIEKKLQQPTGILGIGCQQYCDWTKYRERYPDLRLITDPKQLELNWAVSGSFAGRDCTAEGMVYNQQHIARKRRCGASDRQSVLVLSHYLQMDGAPRLLASIAMLMDEDYCVVVASPKAGPLGDVLTDHGIHVEIRPEFSDWATVRLDAILDEVQPVLVILNTVLWAAAVENLPTIRPLYPKIAWMIHEQELTYNTRLENDFWWGDVFPALKNATQLSAMLHKLDNVIWVADATRAQWSEYDHGHFITFRGFVSIQDVLVRAGVVTEERANGGSGGGIRTTSWLQNQLALAEGRPDRVAELIRNEVQRAAVVVNDVTTTHPDTFVIVAAGTYCSRKRQMWLVEAVSILRDKNVDVRLKLLGKPTKPGNDTESKYAKALEQRVADLGLQSVIDLVPFSENILMEVASADLHLSVSSHESFPLNTLEAMILGTPVALTPAGGSEEQIWFPGEEGFVFSDTSSYYRLANELQRIFALGKSKLAEIGRKSQLRALEQFSDLPAPHRVRNLIKTLLPTERKIDEYKGRALMVVLLRHDTTSLDRLELMLRSLQNVDYPYWTAVIVFPADLRIHGTYSLFSRLNDARFHIVRLNAPCMPVGGSGGVFHFLTQNWRTMYDWVVLAPGDIVVKTEFWDILDVSEDGYRLVDPVNHNVASNGWEYWSEQNCMNIQWPAAVADTALTVLNIPKWRYQITFWEVVGRMDSSRASRTVSASVSCDWKLIQIPYLFESIQHPFGNATKLITPVMKKNGR